MFGQTDDNQTGGSATATQAPSMLDNVTPQDFQTITDPATQPQNHPVAQPVPQYDPQFQQQAPPQQQYQSNNDNPFAQNPIVSEPPAPISQNTPTDISPFGVFANHSTEPASSPWGPVSPPVILSTEDTQNKASSSPVAPDPPLAQTAPVDQAKLADMKQQALAHLEPLADHLDGTPEETFKTTMMMIQANDNHTLIEKALNAAKDIEDDKARAQAMLDIVNEINYFSQDN